jgi:hypothetical protein
MVFAVAPRRAAPETREAEFFTRAETSRNTWSRRLPGGGEGYRLLFSGAVRAGRVKGNGVIPVKKKLDRRMTALVRCAVVVAGATGLLALFNGVAEAYIGHQHCEPLLHE